ncbi:hypothetical protein MKK84_24450 [Methylobacterium sp. E-065]|uniref:hypothetical protein n=1 Tax=Methylobacterium sp. E-065 TaxID=2836583 RepID=UPI001FBA939E|nr:hypothetical protein [Methylobacterium sp. E-065]MCJ2020539.1 hypothetical protein [Methylobacterium sp. E-065]
MPFTIVAERRGVSTYNRRQAAREALFLASSRVQEGAEKVQVYDELGQFVGAPSLAAAAREEVGAVRAVQKAVDDAIADLLTLSPQPYTESTGLTITVTSDDASRPAEEKSPEPEAVPVRSGRVRVFRAAGKRD